MSGEMKESQVSQFIVLAEMHVRQVSSCSEVFPLGEKKKKNVEIEEQRSINYLLKAKMVSYLKHNSRGTV